MDKIDTARALDEAHQAGEEIRADYPPSEFLKQAGLTVAVWLGLALLAQFLVKVIAPTEPVQSIASNNVDKALRYAAPRLG